MNAVEMIQLFRRIKLAYEQFVIPAGDGLLEKVDEWLVHLGKHPASAVNERLNEHIGKGNRFPPSVADLKPEAVPINQAVLAGDAAMREVEQWEREAAPPPADLREKLARWKGLNNRE